ncbi:MAG: SDR family oxidoreductase, partial [Rubrobacteraceae bacterium]
MTEGRLKDKVAVVTGASSGIGAAVARSLSQEGMHVALAARREEALLDVQNTLGEEAKSTICATDVTDRDQVRKLFSQAERDLSPVDVLVNCAGVMYYTLMKNLQEDDWERIVDVNCKGTMNCVGAVLG